MCPLPTSPSTTTRATSAIPRALGNTRVLCGCQGFRHGAHPRTNTNTTPNHQHATLLFVGVSTCDGAPASRPQNVMAWLIDTHAVQRHAQQQVQHKLALVRVQTKSWTTWRSCSRRSGDRCVLSRLCRHAVCTVARHCVCGQQRRGRRVSSHHSTWRQRGHLLCNSPFSNPTHALVVSQPSTTWEQAFTTTTTTTTRWVQRLQSFVAGRHATRKRGLSWSGLVHQARPPSCSS